jgi:hypothetical protein
VLLRVSKHTVAVPKRDYGKSSYARTLSVSVSALGEQRKDDLMPQAAEWSGARPASIARFCERQMNAQINWTTRFLVAQDCSHDHSRLSNANASDTP